MADKQISGVTFRSHAPASCKNVVWKLIRTPDERRFGTVILSQFVVGTDIHFWGGRTRPCLKDVCPACLAGQRPRPAAYLAVTNRDLTGRFIIELPGKAWAAVEQYQLQHRTLRSHKLITWRMGKKSNSPVGVLLEPSNIAPAGLPEAPNVIECLLRLWEVQSSHTPASLLEPERRFGLTGTDDAPID